MNRFIIAILIAFAVSTSAFGATSGDIYLRQDVFEAKMDAFIAEIRLMNEQLRSELKQEIQANSTAIQVTNARLDELKTMVYWGIALLGILITLAAVAPSLVQVIKELSSQKFSLDDVKRLIDAKLENKNA